MNSQIYGLSAAVQSLGWLVMIHWDLHGSVEDVELQSHTIIQLSLSETVQEPELVLQSLVFFLSSMKHCAFQSHLSAFVSSKAFIAKKKDMVNMHLGIVQISKVKLVFF